MNKTQQNLKTATRRGSALVMAIVTTMLLFIIGIAFMITGQMQRSTLNSFTQQDTLGVAVDVVVSKISDVLVDDLLGPAPGYELLDGTTDEYYDYPGKDDRWLASLEPVEIEDASGYVQYVWPHITDLWSQFNMTRSVDSTEYLVIYYDPDDRTVAAQFDSSYAGDSSYDSDPFRSWDFYVPARIVPNDEPIEPTILDLNIANHTVGWPSDVDLPSEFRQHGMRADADGDGIADSRWVRLDGDGSLPNLVDASGEYVYAAIRIIDNGGMININTAYRDPEDPTWAIPPIDEAYWDGTMLSHVNLEGIISQTDFNNGLRVTNVQDERLGPVSDSGDFASTTDYENDRQYEIDVARRLLNPAMSPGNYGTSANYAPFDITDELELRNRFLLMSNVTTRAELVWPVTFNPGTGTSGKQYPYVPGDDPWAWFDKLKPDIDQTVYIASLPIGYYNRRHISTTYNCDRILRPTSTVSAADLTAIGMQETPGQRQFCVRLPDNLYPDPCGAAALPDYILQLAGALYRGLPNDTTIQARFGPEYNRERLACQWAVNLVDYQDLDGGTADGSDDKPTHIEINGRDYFGVENQAAMRRDALIISELGYADVDDPCGFTPPLSNTNVLVKEYYAIELLNPDDVDSKDFGINQYHLILDITDPCTFTVLDDTVITSPIAPGDVVVLVNDPCAEIVFSIDSGAAIIEVPGLTFAAGDHIMLKRLEGASDLTDLPVDMVEVPSSLIGPPDELHSTERTIEVGTGQRQTNLLMEYWNSTTPTIGDAPAIFFQSQMQLDVANEQLRNLGEIVNCYVTGTSLNPADPPESTHTLMRDIVAAIVLLPSDLELGTSFDMRSYGRVNLTDSDYWPVMNYLTYFDYSRDDIDSDGIAATCSTLNANGSDVDPCAVGLNPSLPQSYEQRVWGKININTAPWYVINQLPWVGLDTSAAYTTYLARAIVAFRDKQPDLSGDTESGGYECPNYMGPTGRQTATGIAAADIDEGPGFINIAQLLQVVTDSTAHPTYITEFDIRKYLDSADQVGSPDLTVDNIADDFEERDLIFQRISNLVSVRSDVFTAYILVRIGPDGPQRRMIAIFDRSNVYQNGDRPTLIALHPVPDPQ